MVSIADSEAKKKWDKEHTVYISLKLAKHTDADILKKLYNVPNRQGYIKSLIRQNIETQDDA